MITSFLRTIHSHFGPAVAGILPQIFEEASTIEPTMNPQSWLTGIPNSHMVSTLGRCRCWWPFALPGLVVDIVCPQIVQKLALASTVDPNLSTYGIPGSDVYRASRGSSLVHYRTPSSTHRSEEPIEAKKPEPRTCHEAFPGNIAFLWYVCEP